MYIDGWIGMELQSKYQMIY